MISIEPKNPDCLHCWLSAALTAYLMQHSKRTADGKVIVNVDEVITKIGELVAEQIGALGERPKRRAALAYAHECLDAAFRFAVTGKTQTVVSPDIETEH